MESQAENEVELLGFALGNCVVEINPALEKYLRVVHRTALELAVQNQFGVEVGGFWLLDDQIAQLRRLPQYYSPDEASKVSCAVEAYLSAQLKELYPSGETPWSSHLIVRTLSPGQHDQTNSSHDH